MATQKNFVILRAEKIKTAGGVAAMAAHILRERDTPNAKAELKHLNSNFGAKTTEQAMSLWHERTKDLHTRKNSVVGMNYVISASPGFFEKNSPEENKFYNDTLDWVVKKHGRENVITAAIHRDEHSPHFQAIVVPVGWRANKKTGHREKTLSAAPFMDGRAALSNMQSAFHTEVGTQNGLQRGLVGSKAHHHRVSQFYGLLNDNAIEIKLGKVDKQTLEAAIDHAYFKPFREALWKHLQPKMQKSIRETQKNLDETAVSKALAPDETERLKAEILALEKKLEAKEKTLENKDRELMAKDAWLIELQIHTGEFANTILRAEKPWQLAAFRAQVVQTFYQKPQDLEQDSQAAWRRFREADREIGRDR